MSTFKAGWYLIYTRPKHEKKVSAGLADLGIDHLLPTIRTMRTWCDRKKYIDAPMFPSYVFVNLKTRRDYLDALAAEGTLCYIKFGNEVAVVRDNVINNLRLVLQNGNDIEVSDIRFNPGQQLIIQEGVFTGLACEVVEHQNEHKLIVRLNLLNTNVLASLPGNIAFCAQAS